MPDIMNTMDIAFPHLGIYLRDVPKTIMLGNFPIAWYGVILAVSMLLGIFFATYIARKTGQDPDIYWDLSIWLLLFSIIGARLYYVCFFWDAYKNDPIQILNLRGGGLAIYGAVIGGLLTVIVYARLRKKRVTELLDTVVFGLVLGQITGRWANFMNREVFGGYTDSLLAMRIPIEMVRERDISASLASHIVEGTNYIQVHPTFLYESLWNIGLLLLMLLVLKRRRFRGQITLLYLGGYGLGRGWIEYIRTDQLYFAGTRIPVNMVLGFSLFVVCGIWYQLAGRRMK
ncbi:prolipoprotein diacylglyceryl transferase [Lachnoclostridium sp. Marseille-P6806]|uniref:prolipoprotein diacylglyceryl transferase n=1 Tax=Lachnoclostridium sp. Marseille-P6806 TaxID=2364793 RepID=UPI001030A7EA|nr:prolipoprotein diacylglyceryl transferase [Lachnoclostridium sp. Marseille-P6806]